MRQKHDIFLVITAFYDGRSFDGDKVEGAKKDRKLSQT
jgi:hypothetical protein